MTMLPLLVVIVRVYNVMTLGIDTLAHIRKPRSFPIGKIVKAKMCMNAHFIQSAACALES